MSSATLLLIVIDIIAASRTRGINATVEGELGTVNRKAVSGNYFGGNHNAIVGGARGRLHSSATRVEAQPGCCTAGR